MKRLLSVILFVTITLGTSFISLAAGDVITQDSQEKSGQITVDYNAEVSYTVTIPASVTFTDSEKNIERPLEVKDVMMNEGSTLSVNVASLNNFQMRCGEGYIDYKIMMNYATALEENNRNILSVNAGEKSGWAILSFVTDLKKDNAKYAGNYTDTLTFTVVIN